MEQTKTYRNTIINWHWYVRGDFDDTTMRVTIDLHDRLHFERHEVHPQCFGEFKLQEGNNRIVQAVLVREHGSDEWKSYHVMNPKHVFSYNHFTAEEKPNP